MHAPAAIGVTAIATGVPEGGKHVCTVDKLTSARVASVDIFRGLTVLVMVFVNDLSGARGLPWWTYHMPPGVNGMTYVDMVFPAFLFLVGVSIPVAIDGRVQRGESAGTIGIHIIARSFSLVTLGLLIANAPQFDGQLSLMNKFAWVILALTGIALSWSLNPWSERNQPLRRLLKYVGALFLGVVIITFRRRTLDGGVGWLDFSYWEILGLIGWTYLAVSPIYVFFRKRVGPLALSLVVLCALNVLSTKGHMRWLDGRPGYLWPFEAGLASIAVAGLLASLIFLQPHLVRSFQAKAFWALGYAFVLLTAAQALSPLGVSKELDTPAWCLYCAGASVLIFLALYWLCDIKHSTRWAGFVKPAGTNTLLTYLLPDVIYLLPGIRRISAYGTEGWPAVLKALLFTSCVLGVSSVLTKWKIRLQL